MAIYQIKEEVELAASMDEAWDFISSPANLQEITPDHMGFEIKTPGLPEKIYPGLMISYKVRPVLWIPVTWLTEITHIQEPYYFVDEQRVGNMAHGLFVKKQLQAIFKYREQALDKRFGLL